MIKKMKKNTYKLHDFLSLNLLGLILSLGFILSIFKYMPSLKSPFSTVYLVMAVLGYTGIFWLFISLICWLTYKVTNNLVVPAFISALSILILFFDTKVYSLYRSHLNGGLVEYAVKEAFGEITRIGYSSIAPLTIGTLVSVTCVYFFYRFGKSVLSQQISKKLAASIYPSLVSLFILSQLTYIYADVINYTPIKKWTRHIPFYQPLTAKRSLVKWGIVSPSQLRGYEVKSNYKDNSINYPEQLSCDKKTVKPNVIWLFIDAWRFDSYSAEITPQIFDWVQNENVHSFQNHWSTGGATVPNMFSIFYGIPSTYLKPFTESGTPPLVISQLAKENYEIQISTAWPLNRTSMTNVFKKVPKLRVEIGDREAWQADSFIKDEVFSFLDQRDKKRPFFTFMIFDSAHDYSVPPNYKAPFTPYSGSINYMALGPQTDPTPYFNRYKNSVHYVDSIIGEVLNSPKIQDPNRPTLILISSDHGEQFNDLKKNYWGHNSNFSKYQLKVPMFVLWKNFKDSKHSTNQKFTHMTSHNDISYTLLKDALNCDLKEDQTTGHSLYSKKSRTPLLLGTYSKHGFLDDDKVYSYEPGAGYEVFDYDYNEIIDHDVPPAIFKKYLKDSTKFYH